MSLNLATFFLFPRYDITVRRLHCFYRWLTYAVVLLLSCLGWYPWFDIGLVEFLFVSSFTVIVLLFFSLFFLLILDRTYFGVLPGVSSDEFSDSSSLLSLYKVSHLFWQFMGSFSILLGLQYFLLHFDRCEFLFDFQQAFR